MKINNVNSPQTFFHSSGPKYLLLVECHNAVTVA